MQGKALKLFLTIFFAILVQSNLSASGRRNLQNPSFRLRRQAAAAAAPGAAAKPEVATVVNPVGNPNDVSHAAGSRPAVSAAAEEQAPAVNPNPEPVKVGSFESNSNDISGDVTVIDDKTIKISGFDYDGRGDGSFVLGKGKSSLDEYEDLDDLTIIPDEFGSCDFLSLYRDANIKITLPGNKRVQDFSYLSVYSLENKHNMGYVTFPEEMELKNGTATFGIRNECSVSRVLEDSEEEGSERYKESRQREQATDQLFKFGANIIASLINLVPV